MKKVVLLLVIVFCFVPMNVFADEFDHNHEWMKKPVHQMHQHDFPEAGTPDSVDTTIPLAPGMKDNMPASPFINKIREMVSTVRESFDFPSWMEKGQIPIKDEIGQPSTSIFGEGALVDQMEQFINSKLEEMKNRKDGKEDPANPQTPPNFISSTPDGVSFFGVELPPLPDFSNVFSF
ncbi:hypothetical protein JK635_07790 [Neobacillus sp. YIM B02564]|uniref:Uncharacterized protein n=1 Tax=Neobacillus paridis TaxID=2803862 RepID=A0ABS1TLC1_9BACI|nr:hypothetical protein [Neobacillus paridis]MBL4952111.1 hypothetical protein [Neobacillus paridis]